MERFYQRFGKTSRRIAVLYLVEMRRLTKGCGRSSSERSTDIPNDDVCRCCRFHWTIIVQVVLKHSANFEFLFLLCLTPRDQLLQHHKFHGRGHKISDDA